MLATCCLMHAHRAWTTCATESESGCVTICRSARYASIMESTRARAQTKISAPSISVLASHFRGEPILLVDLVDRLRSVAGGGEGGSRLSHLIRIGVASLRPSFLEPII